MFKKVLVYAMASLLALVFIFGFVILVANIVKCDEKKFISYFEERKSSLEIAYSEFSKVIQKEELEREKDYKSKKIKWISFMQFDKLLLEHMEPAGNERAGNNNLLFYVARTTHLGGTVVGKYCPYLKIMNFGYDGKENHEGIDFEILSFPIGTLSWTPTTVDNVPAEENLVFGGIAPISQEITYICRIVKDGHLIIGKFLNGSGTAGCISSFHGEEYKRSSFEILIINEMGKMMGINA